MIPLYTFPHKPINGGVLSGELITAGLPLAPFGLTVDADTVRVAMTRDLTQPELAALTDAITAHTPPAQRRTREVSAIAHDIMTWIGSDPVKLRRAVALCLALELRQRPGLLIGENGSPPVGDEVVP